MFNLKRKHDKFSPLTVIMLLVLLIWCVAFIYMMLWAFMQSIKIEYEFSYDKEHFPKFDEMTIANYKCVFMFADIDNWMGEAGSPNFAGLIVNTILYAVGGAFLNAAVTCLMAYLTAKYSYFYSKIIYGIVIVVMVVPVVGAQASEIQLLRWLHLYDTRFAFMVLKASFVGMYFLVFYAAFKSIPMTYSEAAMMDGASDWCIMVKICLPLVLNVFMTVFMITFIQYWNDYQLALLYMPHYPTLAYFIFKFKGASTGALEIPGYSEIHGTLDPRKIPVQLAATFTLIFPILLIFIAFHKRLMGNLSIGGIKG
ncbi:MAG: carbohydrate ABC transporter permease [Clostridia bacterium]|nr:carbohydrate ABC transporter permease [Clostridia bacterium]